MGSNRQLHSQDGFTFGVYESLPKGELKASLVVIQEIFGVNNHMREVADGFAAEGYAAIAPQIFDRAKRGVELGYGPEDMAAGFKLAFTDVPRKQIMQDLQATVEECSKYGPVGVVGYCFGGLLTWLSVCDLEGVDCGVVYYGGGIANELDRTPKCPILMHFGELDSFIPLSDIDKIKTAQPDAQVHVYPADHGFNCDHRESFDSTSATLAKSRSLEFFQNHLG
ncbi:MAG: dienelactone hydrolase family protein [Gammaproteobacteria bacterium]|nr:dienelactone hydrolase family protein [Gammaproteobacteria bacterium]